MNAQTDFNKYLQESTAPVWTMLVTAAASCSASKKQRHMPSHNMPVCCRTLQNKLKRMHNFKAKKIDEVRCTLPSFMLCWSQILQLTKCQMLCISINLLSVSYTFLEINSMSLSYLSDITLSFCDAILGPKTTLGKWYRLQMYRYNSPRALSFLHLHKILSHPEQGRIVT